MPLRSHPLWLQSPRGTVGGAAASLYQAAVRSSRRISESRKLAPRAEANREPQPVVLTRGAGLSLTMDSSVLNALRCFVPALVEEMVDAGHRNEWLSASRKMTTLFLKVARCNGHVTAV